MPTTQDLAAELLAFVPRAAEGAWRRFCPAARLPAFVAGERTFGGTRSALLAALPAFAGIGMTTLGGRPLTELIAQELAVIRAADCKTWWSQMVLEALAATGPAFDGHPLLAACDIAQRDELRRACDTTRYVDLATGTLIGHPNNYWFVIARCERLRLGLGLTADRRVLDCCLANCRRVLLANPLCYMDDSEQGAGRYDIYAGHGLVGTLELDELADLRAPYAAAWERLLLACARRDCGGPAWGRSGGFSVLEGTLHSCAELLAHGLAGDPAPVAALAWATARRLLDEGWADDAVTLHRQRRPHWYLGTFRLLERGFLFLKGLAQAGRLLAAAPAQAIDADNACLERDRDTFIRFDGRGPGVWIHRSGPLRFQVPLVDGFTSDYAAAPVWPGVFEQVCDRGMPCGVPVVEMAGKRWLPLRRPVDVVVSPGRCAWTTPCWSHFEQWDWWRPAEDRPGARQVRLRVEDGWLVGEEEWEFPETPTAVGFWFGESDTPLQVVWDCPTPHQALVTVVDGMADWRSHERGIRRLHQIDLEPAPRLRLGWRLRPRG